MAGVLALAGCSQGSVQNVLGLGKRSPDEFAVVKRAPLIIPPDFDLRPPDPGAPRPNIGTTSDQARVAMTGNATAASTATPSAPAPSAASRILGSANAPSANTTSSAGASRLADDLLSAGTNAPVNGTAVDGTPAAAAAQVDGTAATAGVPPARQDESQGEMVLVMLAGGDQASPDIRRALAEENQALADVEASLFTRVVKWREPSTMGATIDAPAEAQRLRDNRIAGRAPTDGDTPTVVKRRQSALQGFLGDIF